MKNRHLPIAAFLAISVAVTVARANNIALNKPVTVVSGAANITNPSTLPSVIDDGMFTPESTAYHSSTAGSEAVEWLNQSPPTILEIDLGSLFNITGAIVQCDDNDSYLLQYFNTSTKTWQTLWDVPAISVGQGLRTRPNADQMTFQSVGPVITNAVRISGDVGDSGFAVSEVQLNGAAAGVPESGSTTMFLSLGLTAMTFFHRKLKGPQHAKGNERKNRQFDCEVGLSDIR
jgi:hypothetical protein